MNSSIGLPGYGVSNNLYVPEGYKVDLIDDANADRSPVYSPSGYVYSPIVDPDDNEGLTQRVSFPVHVKKKVRERVRKHFGDENFCEITGERIHGPVEIMHFKHAVKSKRDQKDYDHRQSDIYNAASVSVIMHLAYHLHYKDFTGDIGLDKGRNEFAIENLRSKALAQCGGDFLELQELLKKASEALKLYLQEHGQRAPEYNELTEH